MIINPETLCQADQVIKENLLINFICLQMKVKNSKKTLSGGHEHGIKIQKKIQRIPMNTFMMDKEMGPETGQSWRDCGLCPIIACPLTGVCSDEARLKWYHVPKTWSELSEEDYKSLKLEVSGEAGEGAEQVMDSFASISVGSLQQMMLDSENPDEVKLGQSVSSATIILKKENKPESEILAEKVAAFCSDPLGKGTHYTNMKLDCTSLLAQATKEKDQNHFIAMLYTDLEQCVDKLSKTIEAFDLLSRKKHNKVNKEELVRDCESVENEYQDCLKWATQFGYKSTKKQRRK